MNKQIFIALVIHAHYKQKRTRKLFIFNYGDIKQFFIRLLVINMY